MMITATKEGHSTVYRIRIDDIERQLINLQPGDREFIKGATESSLVSEKIVGIALVAKRIEEGRKVAEILEKAQPVQSPEISTRNGDGNPASN